MLTLTKPAESVRVRRYRRAAGAFAQSRIFGADQARRQHVRRRSEIPRRARRPTPFNRWQAVQTLATRLLRRQRRSTCARAKPARRDSRPARRTWRDRSRDGALEPAFVALVLTLPGEADIAREIGRDVDPDAIFAARSALRAAVGEHLAGPLFDHYRRLSESGLTGPMLPSAGRRALRNICLDLLVATGRPDAMSLAAQQYQAADNMTDRMAALTTLSLRDVPERTAALDDFYARYARRSADRRQMVHAAGHHSGARDAGPGEGADRASRLLVRQSQSRARLDQRIRDGEPEGVQPRRRRGLRVHRRHGAGARSARIRNSRRACCPRSRAGACSSPAGARWREKPLCSASRPRPRSRPTWPTSSSALSPGT